MASNCWIFFAEHSEPDKISRLTKILMSLINQYLKIFFVKVSPAAALEFQHYKDIIIEKINSLFWI